MPAALLPAAAFGLILGSFLNVVIWRVPRGESIVSPPSACTRAFMTSAAVSARAKATVVAAPSAEIVPFNPGMGVAGPPAVGAQSAGPLVIVPARRCVGALPQGLAHGRRGLAALA